jgi:hypothetical protein
VVVPPLVVLPMVVPPSSAKLVLVLSLILAWHVHYSWLILPLCLVLVVKASSLECDGTIWWKVDDLWWSFLSAWSLPCFTNFVSWVVREHLVSYVVLLSHSFVLSFVDLGIVLDLLLYSLFLLCKGLADNTYQKEYTNNSKQG